MRNSNEVKLIGSNRRRQPFRTMTVLMALGVVLALAKVARAADSLCATVKIEIQQELTLERQAFDAHMRINNGLSNIRLENVGVVVTFADADGNSVSATSDPTSTNALFFIRIDSMENIGNVSGSGTVAPSTSADIHWLIIPAFGAGGSVATGVRYLVGARLTYRIDGTEHVIDVVPDSILVKPMPLLELDYFLPVDVYGDDTFTLPIEPPVPFSVGVRVRNTGAAVARSVKIDSAQPKIVENDLGLLIGFSITGSEVNGSQVSDGLLVNFGDIQPNRSGVARWEMTTTLSGRFVEFSASYTHADELGGNLTSLLSTNGIRTHFLVHDVVVDFSGRDSIRDFLAVDGNVLRVYESQNNDTVVADLSLNSSLADNGNGSYRLIGPPTSGLAYFKLTDPLGGQRSLSSALRADGKTLNAANAWLSKTQDRNTHLWHYFVNVFDVNNTEGLSYTLQYAGPTTPTNHPPHIEPINNWTVKAGNHVCFFVTASDPDGNPLTYSFASPPPAGATIDAATGFFDWQPTLAQGPGTNLISVLVSDNGTPSMSVTGSFTVVTEINSAPVLTTQTNRIITELTTLIVTNTASDIDVPRNVLTYQLLSAPGGAAIDGNGVITWTPSEAQGPSTNVIQTVVTDDGLPHLSATNSFIVIVEDSTVTVVFQKGLLPTTNFVGCLDSILRSFYGDVFGRQSLGKGQVLDPRWRDTEGTIIIQFDLSSIPQTAQVQSATLKLWHEPSQFENKDGAMLLYPLHDPNGTGMWEENNAAVTADYFNGPMAGSALLKRTNAPWSSIPDGRFTTVRDGSEIIRCPHQAKVTNWLSFDVTRDVILYVTNPTQNLGWVCYTDVDDTIRGRLHTADYPTPSKRPMLEVTYRTAPAAPTNPAVRTFIQDSNFATVTIEAENYTANTRLGIHQCVLVTNGLASGGLAMQFLPDVGINIDSDYILRSSHLEFKVLFARTGTYYVWIRYYATGNTSDSMHLSLDGLQTTTSDRMTGSRYNVWDWSNQRTNGMIATVNITTPGFHTVSVFMREDGFILDRFLLTLDPSYLPTGLGPPETISAILSNMPPIFSRIGNKSVSVGSLLAFTVSATDPENEFISYVASGIPFGATFISQSFNWTPTLTQTGTYSLTFYARDPESSQANETIQIAVWAPADLRIDMRADATNHIVSWFARQCYRYDLLTKTNFSDPWTIVPGYSNILGTDVTLNYTNRTTDRFRVYAIRARQN